MNLPRVISIFLKKVIQTLWATVQHTNFNTLATTQPHKLQHMSFSTTPRVASTLTLTHQLQCTPASCSKRALAQHCELQHMNCNTMLQIIAHKLQRNAVSCNPRVVAHKLQHMNSSAALRIATQRCKLHPASCNTRAATQRH